MNEKERDKREKWLEKNKMDCQTSVSCIESHLKVSKFINDYIKLMSDEFKKVKLENGQSVYEWFNGKNDNLEKFRKMHYSNMLRAELLFYQYGKFLNNSIRIKDRKNKVKPLMTKDQLEEARILINQFKMSRNVVAHKYRISVSTLRKYLKNGLPQYEKNTIKNQYETIKNQMSSDLKDVNVKDIVKSDVVDNSIDMKQKDNLNCKDKNMILNNDVNDMSCFNNNKK